MGNVRLWYLISDIYFTVTVTFVQKDKIIVCLIIITFRMLS